MKSIKQIIRNPYLVTVVLTLILPLLFCKMVLAQVSQVASDPSTKRDFHYEKAPCPFDTTGYDIEHMQCGYLTVPENRDVQNDRTIRLAVANMTASYPGTDFSPIIFIQGGPGGRSLGTGIHFAETFHRWFPHHDVIVYDARGTGYSGRLCPGLNETYHYRDALDLTTDEARRMTTGANRACYDRLMAQGVDVSGYNTRENAADINDIRRALGYRHLDLIAISYGPMVAQAVIRDFPGTVRAAVLYGPVPLSGFAQQGETYLTTFGRALDKVFARCRQEPACNAEYPHLKQKFKETVSMLQKRPLIVPVSAGVAGTRSYVVNSQDFVDIVHERMHNSKIAGLPALIANFHDRDVDRIRRAVEATMHGGVNDFGTYFSVACHDGPPSRNARKRLTASWPALNETAGVAWDMGTVACRYWKSGHASAAELDAGTSDAPVLVIHGSLDPIISPEDVAAVMKTYPHSRKIELPGAGHSPSPRTLPCTAQIMASFYGDPSVPLDTSCVAKLPPLKFKLPEKN